MYFKIKKQTPLRKLMDAYCQRQSVDHNSIRFLYDGQRIQPEQTPKEVALCECVYLVSSVSSLQLEMDDNDIIDAVLQQVNTQLTYTH